MRQWSQRAKCINLIEAKLNATCNVSYLCVGGRCSAGNCMGMICTWWVVERWDEEALQCHKYTKLPATPAELAAGVFGWLCVCTLPSVLTRILK